MMKKKQKLIIVLILISVLLLNTSCAYVDMNRVLFATSTCLDINKDGQIVIYTELFSAKRSSTDAGEEVKMIHKGEGKTIYKGFMLGQTTTELPITYDILKATIFSERAARKGLDILMDGFKRNQKPSLKQYMFICEQPLEEIISLQLPEEMFLGFYLESYMIYTSNVAYVDSIRVNEFFNNRYSGNCVNLIPIIKKFEQTGSVKLDISGAAVIVDDKMVSELDKEEVSAYKTMTDDLIQGELTVVNPMEPDKDMSIVVLKCKTNKDLIMDEDNNSNIDLDTEILVNIPEVQGKIILTDPEIREKVRQEISNKIKLQCSALFNKYQEDGIDLLNLERDIKMKYPYKDFNIKDTKLNINVKVDIDGSGISTNSN